ncbi:MAG: RsmD family RNA methyltransferase [Thermoguttaceae bacterium]|nr:RsmD family RNA methyltransferase [Thermoguttaceae bacterium]
MKNKPSRKSRRENYDDFDESPDDLTVTPYMSGAEFCKKFASDGKKKSKSSGDSREVFDASGDADSDLWNKGSEGFKSRRRRSLETVKSRRRQQAREEAQEAAQEEKRKRSKRNKNVGSEPGDRGDSVGLRVVGGIFRGTKLRYAGDRRVRPMKERVREAIFNLLGESVKGKHAIDLFTGTGALCFEAISRGARSATAIEIHFPTAKTTRDNIKILDEKEPGTAQKIELITTDVYFWGRKLAAEDPEAEAKRSPLESSSQANLPKDVPWIVFCSPPYDFFVDREGETLELLQTLRDRAPKGSIFVIEADDRFDFDLLEADIPPKKRRSYPPAEIGIFTV